MNDRPLVSIVMPTYNRAHMVGEAIDAVLAQIYTNWELILVNDGSKDNTREVIDGYAARDPRIRCIHKENEGIPDTVNRGWREATGEYVTWTSDDNLYHPSSIEAMAAYLDTHADVVLVYTDCRYIDEHGKVTREHQGGDPDVLEDNCPIMGCLLFRRAVLEAVGPFRKRWRRVHDYDFYRRVYKRFPVARLPVILYDYRMHGASMTGNHYAMTTEQAQLLDECFRAEGNGEARRKAWGRCWAEVARQALRENRRWVAAWYYARAWLHDSSGARLCINCLKGALYTCLPETFRRMWRSAKGVPSGCV